MSNAAWDLFAEVGDVYVATGILIACLAAAIHLASVFEERG